MTVDVRRAIEKAIDEGKRDKDIARELHVKIDHVQAIRCAMSPFLQKIERRVYKRAGGE